MMKTKKFRFENFKTVFDFEQALNERPVNPLFDTSSGSNDKDRSGWFQTSNYAEADEFLTKGWNAKIDEVKSVLEKFSSQIAVKRRKQIVDYVGFMPCVPSAIKGYPKSMINQTKREKIESQRTKHIIFDNTQCAGTSGESLLKSGLTVLKLAMILDKSNVRTQIDVVPFDACCGDSYFGCTVTIKTYRQPFNYLKMAYPIANPSFFRRHGFRWLEVQEGDSSEMSKWVGGYGGSLYRGNRAEEYLKWAGMRKDGVVLIKYDDCKRADFDAEKLMENLGIK